MAYQKGVFASRVFHQRRSADRVTIRIGEPEGSYRPARRPLELQLWWDGSEPARISNGGTDLERRNPDDLEHHRSGWAVRPDGFLVIRQPDRFEATEIVIER